MDPNNVPPDIAEAIARADGFARVFPEHKYAIVKVISLLDNVPIMTIAYDRTRVAAAPIRWNMPRILGVSAVLGLFCIVESVGLLMVGIRILSHPQLQLLFGLVSEGQL
jgi:H+-transporting ATPase